MKMEKQGFRIRPGHPAAIAGMIAFALSIPMQILGYSDNLKNPVVAAGLVFLPVLSAFLMIVMLLKFGQHALRLSVFPVFIGVLGFALKLVLDPRRVSLLHHLFASLLYLAIITFWALTVLYVIRTKWVLVILFAIPFLKHIFMDDLPVLLGTAAPVPASTWLKEFSMLFFMLALFFSTLAFEKIEQ